MKSAKILKILVPIVIGGMIISVGITISYFQDIEKSKNNIFSAGSLDLKINDKDGAEAIWKAENIMPSDKSKGEINLQNTGSIPIKRLIMEVEIER